MTPGFLANVNSVLEKADEAVTLNTEAEVFFPKNWKQSTQCCYP